MLEQLGKTLHPQILADAEAVAQAAAEQILLTARRAIAERGQFKLVLAGGSTPQAAYRLLVTADTPWQQWHIYFGDERCLAVDDPERNSCMAAEAWLDHVAIPREQIHPIAAEQGAESAAAQYGALIEAAQPFDLVLLGMGEDGHTASLFPGQQHEPLAWVLPVHQAPKPPSDRVSLSARALSATTSLLLMVTGEAKHQALQRWANGEALPVASVKSQGAIELLLDRQAAGE